MRSLWSKPLYETAWPAPVRHERCLQLLAITRSCCRKPRACIDMQNNGEIAASKTRAFVGPWTRLFMVRYAVITRHKSAKDGCNCLYRTWYETMPSPVLLLMWLCPLWQLSGGLPAGAGIRQQMRDKVRAPATVVLGNFWLSEMCNSLADMFFHRWRTFLPKQ